MPTTHYLGTLASGAIVSRKSTRSDFTHAAARPSYNPAQDGLPSFSVGPEGARRNFYTSHRPTTPCEVVPVQIVTAKKYREALVAAAAARIA